VEKLAGKLRWERTANGIRVLIPGWMGWHVPFLIPWMAGWTWGGMEAYKAFAKTGNSFLTLWLLMWAVGEIIVGWCIVWSFLGRVVLTLDPANLNLDYLLAGFHIFTREFPTNEMKNLRYRARGRGRSQNMSSIAFEYFGKTCCFAAAITDSEAIALIDKMLDVYPFPKSRGLEYVDFTR
jgi:hypothetical protein